MHREAFVTALGPQASSTRFESHRAHSVHETTVIGSNSELLNFSRRHPTRRFSYICTRRVRGNGRAECLRGQTAQDSSHGRSAKSVKKTLRHVADDENADGEAEERMMPLCDCWLPTERRESFQRGRESLLTLKFSRFSLMSFSPQWTHDSLSRI